MLSTALIGDLEERKKLDENKKKYFNK